jgi:molybdopterin-biosynthesis enzyme MoeA-like protein
MMGFGLYIIGDEIVSGKRQDKHFARIVQILGARGLGLDWVLYLGDDRARHAEALRRSFAAGDIVFSCGGIGATPDDHTRQAAAEALGVPLVAHPEAQALIAERSREVGLPLTPGRLEMGVFPEGASIIPNPVNRIAGFALREHWFVPGFPEMAWPMLEWVLDTHYRHLFNTRLAGERAMLVRGLAEATLTPLMLEVERDFPGVKVFSLPHLTPDVVRSYEIELGVKGAPEHLDPAFVRLREGALALGGRVDAA